jgi:hypothetical protein
MTGVNYITDGVEYLPAKAVLLASFTYENAAAAALEIGGLPNGLSNNHKQVGRHYQPPSGAPVSALFPFNLDSWSPGCRRRAWLTAGPTTTSSAGLDFIGGAICGRCPTSGRSRLANTFGRAPGWGAQWKAFIKENTDRSRNSHPEDDAAEDNYLDLDPVADPATPSVA